MFADGHSEADVCSKEEQRSAVTKPTVDRSIRRSLSREKVERQMWFYPYWALACRCVRRFPRLPFVIVACGCNWHCQEARGLAQCVQLSPLALYT